jgi:uncharacterized protein YbaR (Trm112 family)
MTQSPAPRDESAATANLFDPRMLDFLVCPFSHSRLEYDAAAQELVSKSANMAFPIRNGIPVMLASEARALDE